MNSRSKRNVRLNRSATSLFEMHVMMSLVAGIFATSSVILQKTYKLHSDSLRHWNQQRSLQSLCYRWQCDIHEAEEIDLPSKNVLQMRHERSIVYRTDEQGYCIRQVWHNDTLLGFDRFDIGKPIELEFARDDSGSVGLIQMNLSTLHDNQRERIATIFARVGIETRAVEIVLNPKLETSDAP